jgi:hypothetical protein
VLLAVLTLLAAWSIAAGLLLPLLVVALIPALLLFARWPSISITVIYPLAWIFWTYTVPVIGSIERLIGLMGLAGLLLLILRQRVSLRFPSKWIAIGIFLFLLGYLVAWLLNPNSVASEFVGITLRMVFLALAYFHIRTPSQVSQVSRLMIISALFASSVTLAANITLGFGYYRLYGGAQNLVQHFGIFSHPALASTFAAAPGVLLLTTYSEAKHKSRRLLIALFSLYILWMAFISQYRRELLITLVLLMVLFVLDRRAGIRRPAWLMLIVSTLFFLLIFLPNSTVFQRRLTNETIHVIQGTETRILNFEAGLSAFLHNPLGYGPGMYASTARHILGSGYYNWQYYSYSVFTSVAVEGGVIALLGICILLTSTLWESVRWRASAEGPENWVLRSAPALLLVILIWFVFGNAIDVGLPWYIIGLILSAVRSAKENARDMFD